VEFDDLQNLPGAGTNAEEGSSVEPTHPPGAIAPNAVNELVADLLETTGLVSPDRLAGVRSAAVGGSIAQAIVDEGLAASGVDTPPPSPIGARGLRQVATDHSHLPQVDLNAEGVDKNAAGQIPTHVLERAMAIPYKLEDDRLFVAVADPTNVQAVDELRIATRYTLEVGVAPAAFLSTPSALRSTCGRCEWSVAT
jgi:type IV pilus assembly protein PilB